MAPATANPPSPPFPYVNFSLIGISFLTYLWEFSLGSGLPQATEMLGFVPAHFHDNLIRHHSPAEAILPLFTSLFMHEHSLHLIPNLFLLYFFGEEVEITMGHARYLWFFLAGGLGAEFIYYFSSPSSNVPLIGASGAISGVMAAYICLFPGIRVTTLFIIVWVLFQFVYAAFASVFKLSWLVGFAWWAHAGGFLIGLVLIPFFAPRGVKLIFLPTRKPKPPED